MPTTHTPGPWYATNAGNDHQGLILDEKTGASVAVTYDRCHAPLIAAAPAMYEALQSILAEVTNDTDGLDTAELYEIIYFIRGKAKSALAQAEGIVK